MRAVGVDIAKGRQHRKSPWAIVIAGGAIATFIGFATAGSVLVTAINADAGISARLDPSVTSSASANNVDAATLKKVTADCRGQVKAYAQYNETSWWARHQMLKKCIADSNHVCRQC